MKEKEFFCNLTAMFWKYYLLEPTKEHFEEMFSYFSDQLVLIGTGKHEFYTDMQQILESLTENQVEAECISFQVLDEWYECLMVTQDVFLVYGGIWVRQQEQAENEVLIDMDTRFSMVYRKHNETYEIVHLHHSIPYVDQQNGEYYPKTLSEKAKDAMLLAKLFEKKSEMDLMTEIYNNVSFKYHAMQHMENYNSGNLYLFDLDNFKFVNDTYGHAIGDEVLKLFSQILRENFSSEAILGRMGGDEFAVFELTRLDGTSTVQKILSMQETFNTATETILAQSRVSFSVGIVSVTDEECDYDKVFTNADHALYRAKQQGRQTYYWHQE